MTSIDRRTTTRAPQTNTTTTMKPTAAPATSAADDVEDFATVAPRKAEVDLDGGAGVIVTAQKAFGPTPNPRAPHSTFATAELAAAAVQERFGVSLQGSWSLEELSRLHETFMQLGQKERDAVRGLEVRREHGASADGVTAGLFKHVDGADDTGQLERGASITFYDAAFPSSGDSGLDRQTTMGVVLHEVGHALEGHALSGPVGEQRGAARVMSDVKAFERRLGPDHQDAVAALRAFDNDGAVAPLVTAIKAWSLAHGKLSNPATSLVDRRAALVDLQREHARATALAAALPATHPARQAAQKLIELNTEVTAAQRGYLDAAQRAEDAAVEIIATGAMPDDLETDPDETLGALELEFSTMKVTTTDYGATAPVENFAEGYMLYKRDPAKLSPKALDFFKRHFPI